MKLKVTALKNQFKVILDSLNGLKNDSHRDYSSRYQSNNDNRYSPYENSCSMNRNYSNKSYNSKYRDSNFNHNYKNNNDRDKRQIRIKGNCYTCDKPGHSFRDCRSTKPCRY